MSRQSAIEQLQTESIGVLLGGLSAERDVSLNSGNAVLDALRRRGYRVAAIDPANADFIAQVQGQDRLFVALHGPGGEDGSMQGFLEILDKPYTGSGIQASALAMDKLKSKQLWQLLELSTPASMVLHEETTDLQQGMRYPVFVKPCNEGSSIGMTKAVDSASLVEAWRSASEFGGEVFAEQGIEGAEFTVAVLGQRALAPIRLETDHVFYDYDAKYIADDTRYICPCGLAAEDEARLKTLALDAFNALGCQGWGRVDVMQDKEGEFYLLEVNTVPGMTSHSLVPMAAKAEGMSFDDLCEEILLLSVLNNGEEGHS